MGVSIYIFGGPPRRLTGENLPGDEVKEQAAAPRGIGWFDQANSDTWGHEPIKTKNFDLVWCEHV